MLLLLLDARAAFRPLGCDLDRGNCAPCDLRMRKGTICPLAYFRLKEKNMFVEKTLRRKEKRVEKRKASKRGRVAKIEGEKKKICEKDKKDFSQISAVYTRTAPGLV